ncbi:MAG: UvrD-helicase domain-containing protein, partial [Candidatus Thermoplasmatota archaeon]|nr:UvrD-helicase domain-containing protein [Candidatus Thermoplasmatota archaeon]
MSPPPGPNAQQAKLIDTTEGIVLVDAGAGTGKTFTIARRYLHILEAHDLDPEDLLLITFTRNGAEEMRERILHLSDLPPSRLREAPISTFHARARRVLAQGGFHAPEKLGIQEPLAPTFGVMEDRVLEREAFASFMRRFRDEHPEHQGHLATLYGDEDLLALIKDLASKGIAPTADGWYRDSEALLDGDPDDFAQLFAAVNHTDGRKQSDLRTALNGYKDRVLPPDAPSQEAIRGEEKDVDPRWAHLAFEEDREALKAFVRDVYHGYLAESVAQNRLNFEFLQLLAYVLMVEDETVRREHEARYVMIDEFQDTSEVQFQLALLFMGAPHLCCVGDWKQSIYSFQHADVENIQRFRPRLHRYVQRLNRDAQRVPLDPGDEITVREVPLVENYRSTQAILELAEHALLV